MSISSGHMTGQNYLYININGMDEINKLSPGIASHLVMASVAVGRMLSSGTSWSTRPIFKASGAL